MLGEVNLVPRMYQYALLIPAFLGNEELDIKYAGVFNCCLLDNGLDK